MFTVSWGIKSWWHPWSLNGQGAHLVVVLRRLPGSPLYLYTFQMLPQYMRACTLYKSVKSGVTSPRTQTCILRAVRPVSLPSYLRTTPYLYCIHSNMVVCFPQRIMESWFTRMFWLADKSHKTYAIINTRASFNQHLSPLEIIVWHKFEWFQFSCGDWTCS